MTLLEIKIKNLPDSHVFIRLNLLQTFVKLIISIEVNKLVQMRGALTQQKLFPKFIFVTDNVSGPDL